MAHLTQDGANAESNFENFTFTSEPDVAGPGVESAATAARGTGTPVGQMPGAPTPIKAGVRLAWRLPPAPVSALMGRNMVDISLRLSVRLLTS